MGDQVPYVPPLMTDGEIRVASLTVTQDMNSQSNAITLHIQAMTAQMNREDEGPQYFLNEVYEILYGMGVTSIQKTELEVYQLKNVAQTRYVQWRDNKTLRGGPLTLEIFKKDFLERLFPKEMREVKVEELTNLRQGVMSVLDYSFKFNKLSNCGKSGHKVWYCANVKGQDKVNGEAQASGSNVDAPKRNHFYALCSRGEQDSSLDMVTARMFDIFPDILNEHFMVTTRSACNIISKGCLYHILRVKDLDPKNPPIELVLIVREFPKVFTNDLPRILLNENQLFAKYRKCEFSLSLVAFLGYINSSDGVEVHKRKIEVVNNCPRQLTPADIRSFFGSSGLLQEACERSFQILKERLTSNPVLTLSECTKGLVVYCDASQVGLRANVVADALSRMTMGSVSHVEEAKTDLVKFVHRLARLGVRLEDSPNIIFMVNHNSESSLVVEVNQIRLFYSRDVHILGGEYMQGCLWMRLCVAVLEVNPKRVGTKVKLSTTFHAQTDVQAVYAIQTLEDMPRACIIDFKGNWDRQFPLVEFSYNNSYNSSIFISPFESFYELRLPSELASVHPMFHVSILKKCIGDPKSILPIEGIVVEENLSYEEVSDEILDRQIEKLRNKEVSSVKVLWNNQLVDDEIQEAEADMKSRYIHSSLC
ncbi:hypothetical protein EJD97_002658 [Solanum chilense]|uniref:Retrotransposon gag domain-containing protein n=1 Tax=Solanum chilense TaxID=4083 RepID=A0A6N2BVC9_SOLCI|nr:hypothetical protein EJD97_002658 [Solanum chilense]